MKVSINPFLNFTNNSNNFGVGKSDNSNNLAFKATPHPSLNAWWNDLKQKDIELYKNECKRLPRELKRREKRWDNLFNKFIIYIKGLRNNSEVGFEIDQSIKGYNIPQLYIATKDYSLDNNPFTIKHMESEKTMRFEDVKLIVDRIIRAHEDLTNQDFGYLRLRKNSKKILSIVT